MRILVALDGSERSELALRAALPLLRAEGGEAVLLVVLDEHLVHGTPAGGSSIAASPATVPSGASLPGEPSAHSAEDRGQAMSRAAAVTRDYLAGVASRNLEGIPVTLVVEWADQPSEGIVRVARRDHVDAIAIGTHGRKGFGRAFLGSVADAVLKVSNVPVLLAREGMRFDAGTGS